MSFSAGLDVCQTLQLPTQVPHSRNPPSSSKRYMYPPAATTVSVCACRTRDVSSNVRAVGRNVGVVRTKCKWTVRSVEGACWRHEVSRDILGVCVQDTPT